MHTFQFSLRTTTVCIVFLMEGTFQRSIIQCSARNRYAYIEPESVSPDEQWRAGAVHPARRLMVPGAKGCTIDRYV